MDRADPSTTDEAAAAGTIAEALMTGVLIFAIRFCRQDHHPDSQRRDQVCTET
jgi:hypothetical protein